MDLSQKDLKKFYERLAVSPFTKTYLTLVDKLEEACDSLNETKVTVGDDGNLDEFLKFADKIGKILTNMSEILIMIDPETAAKIKSQQTEVTKRSLEDFVLKSK